MCFSFHALTCVQSHWTIKSASELKEAAQSVAFPKVQHKGLVVKSDSYLKGYSSIIIKKEKKEESAYALQIQGGRSGGMTECLVFGPFYAATHTWSLSACIHTFENMRQAIDKNKNSVFFFF